MKCFDETSETRMMLYMNLLCFISTQIQTQLPYHISKGRFICLVNNIFEFIFSRIK